MRADLRKNHFELFGLPVGFPLDTQALTTRYRDLQRQLHPDRFANASDPERRLSLQMTAQINEAYQVLKDPLSRGRYLLQLRGVDVDAETDTAMAPAFLMEQMDLREAVSDLKVAGGPPSRLDALRDDVAARQAQRTTALERALAEEVDAAIAEARGLVREMQFLAKLQREIEALETELV